MVIWRQLPAHHDAMHKVRRQLPALAALVDLWWQGVRQDLEPFLLAPKWQQGYTSASSLWSIGRTRSLGRGVIDGKPRYNPSSPKHFSNNVLYINMLEEKFGLLLVATFW